jgi:hypothetical protein
VPHRDLNAITARASENGCHERWNECSKTPHGDAMMRMDLFRGSGLGCLQITSWGTVSLRLNFELGLAFLLAVGCGGSGDPPMPLQDGPAAFYRARGDTRPDAFVALVSADARTQLMVRVPDPASEAANEAQIDTLVIRDGKPLASVSCRLSSEAGHVRALHSCGGTAAIPSVSFAVPARAMVPDSTPEELASVIASTAAVVDIATERVVSDGGTCRAGCDHRTLTALIGCLFQNPTPHCSSRAFQYDVACYMSCPG